MAKYYAVTKFENEWLIVGEGRSKYAAMVMGDKIILGDWQTYAEKHLNMRVCTRHQLVEVFGTGKNVNGVPIVDQELAKFLERKVYSEFESAAWKRLETAIRIIDDYERKEKEKKLSLGNDEVFDVLTI